MPAKLNRGLMVGSPPSAGASVSGGGSMCRIAARIEIAFSPRNAFRALSISYFTYYWAGSPRTEKYPGLYEAKTFLFLSSSVFAFWGLLIALGRRHPSAQLYLLLLVSYPDVYYFTFPHSRYRHPIEPEMLILIVFLASQFSVSSLKARAGSCSTTL
ncbi:MAG: hypothetical protein ACLQFM_11200 [Terriglobales bacterium]